MATTTTNDAALDQVRRRLSALRARSQGAGRPFDTRIQLAGSGDEITAGTIQEMSRLAIDGSRDPLVRLMAIDILDGVQGRDHDAVARRFFSWMQDQGSGERSGVKFVNDPFRTEQVRCPWWTLVVEGCGDCNSAFATTVAALLLSVGVPCFFRTVAADPGRPSSFSHVYTVANIRGVELPLDSSVAFSMPGSEPTQITRQKDWPIRHYEEDDLHRGAGSLLSWIKLKLGMAA